VRGSEQAVLAWVAQRLRIIHEDAALRYVVDSRAVDQPRVTRRENALHRFLCFLLCDVLNLGLEGSPETLGENRNEGKNAEDQDGRGNHHLDERKSSLFAWPILFHGLKLLFHPNH